MQVFARSTYGGSLVFSARIENASAKAAKGRKPKFKLTHYPLFAFVRVESDVVDWAQRILVGKGGLAPPL